MSRTPLDIFLCHSSSDKSKVRALYQRLEKDGFNPWLDEENLIPGQEWQTEIQRAVRDSDVVIICLSNNSISKSGYVQKEIKYALDIADEKTEGTIFLIPLKLEECRVPERLGTWQWVNYFEETGYDRLLMALQARAWKLGLLIEEVHVNQVCAPLSDLPGSEIAVKFTPDSYPQKLIKARFYISEYSKPWTEFEVRLYKDQDSMPGERLDSGNIRASGNMGSEWVEVDLSKQGIMIEEGSFFISMYWLTASGSRGGKAQLLGAQFAKDETACTYFMWAHDREWVLDTDRNFFVDVAFSSGMILKGYLLD